MTHRVPISTDISSSAVLLTPTSLTSEGNVYIGDSSNNCVRKVTISTGVITTIAGSSTSGGYSGDNGQATAATLKYPHGLAVDASGIAVKSLFLSFCDVYFLFLRR